MARVLLKFKSICRISGKDDRGLLILVDSASERQLAVPCDHHTIEEFLRRLDQKTNTSQLLPEAIWAVLRQQVDMGLEILIDGLQPTGDYSALLIHEHTLASHPIDIREGILLSLASKGEVPIFVEENFYRRQSTLFNANQVSISVPLDVMSPKTLQEALQRALDDENYELASILRDELKRRQKANNGASIRERDLPEQG